MKFPVIKILPSFPLQKMYLHNLYKRSKFIQFIKLFKVKIKSHDSPVFLLSRDEEATRFAKCNLIPGNNGNWLINIVNH